jgi:hypothetical protein|tara:strand:- start:296 stop:583 length:288 start_codon:yes stop_codon:yes gene_type:complete
MMKYIRIQYTASKSAIIPVGQGLFAELTSATVVKIYSSADSTYYFSLTTTGATFAMITAIQSACVLAASTSWVDAVQDVVLPEGEDVTDITIAEF